MTRVAAIDCGTNSIRLLVADLPDEPSDPLVDVVRRMEIVRLGAGVDTTGRISPEAMDRTRSALAAFTAELRQLGARRVRMVATSATRDAANTAEFHDMVMGTLGVPPEVITGDEEAALSYTGAVRGLSGIDPPVLVADIGGGSTEIVLGGRHDGRTGGEPEAAVSVDIGCVRMTERHLRHDPPTAEEIAAARADIASALASARRTVPLDKARTVIGLAGSVTTVAAIALGLPHYDPGRIHHSRIPAGRIAEISDELLGMSHAERAALPVMHPGRVDVIGAGALITRMLTEEAGATEVVASEHDILDGMAWSLARG